MMDLSEQITLLCHVLSRRPEPRWRIWCLLAKHNLGALDVVELIKQALHAGYVYEHEGLLYVNRYRKEPVRHWAISEEMH